MTKRKKLFLLLLIIILIPVSVLFYHLHNSSKLTKAQKIEDFNYMYETIKDGYPFLDVNKRLNNIDWLAKKDEYIKRISNTKTDKDYLNEMGSIVYELKNGHTGLIDLRFYGLMKEGYEKTKWYDFFNNKTVQERYKNYKKYSTTTLSKVNANTKNLILKDAVSGKVGYMYIPQMYSGDKLKKDMEDISKYLNNIKNYDSLIIDIRGNGGGSDAYWQTMMSLIVPSEYKTCGYELFRANPIIKNYLAKRCIPTEDISLLPKEVDKNVPPEVRSSFSSFLTLNKRVTPKNNSIKFKGKIYLLIDKNVYSSSESFSIFCKESKMATLVGCTTGGDGGGLDPVLFNLKNSGVIVRMSCGMYLTQSGICDDEKKTVPDYTVSDVTRTNNLKDDKCVQKVLELQGIK